MCKLQQQHKIEQSRNTPLIYSIVMEMGSQQLYIQMHIRVYTTWIFFNSNNYARANKAGVKDANFLIKLHLVYTVQYYIALVERICFKIKVHSGVLRVRCCVLVAQNFHRPTKNICSICCCCLTLFFAWRRTR